MTVDETAISFDRIRDARRRGAGIVKVTPLDFSTTFSRLCGYEVHLKLENLQKTGSFKTRGALNKIQLLDDAARARGVTTASAGNHAQGVAYAAQRVGVPVTVVMPETAPYSKANATTGYGARVELFGRDYSEALAHATRLAEESGATFVHGFDDDDIIAGQGTLGLEILEQLPDADTVVVPVGGGGLIAGVIAALRGSRARVVGVQAEGASTLIPSRSAGSPLQIERVDTIADGLAVRKLGARPFEILRTGLDDAVEVSDPEIAAAILLLLERAKSVVEGAGAVGLAACLAGRIPSPGKKVVVVISGGNIDTNLLDRIINLGLVKEGRLFRFTTRVPDRPGQLQRIVACVAACRANIHQVWHERSQPGLPLTEVSISMEVETRGCEHAEEVERALAREEFVVR
jgi:threonine dehydratase